MSDKNFKVKVQKTGKRNKGFNLSKKDFGHDLDLDIGEEVDFTAKEKKDRTIYAFSVPKKSLKNKPVTSLTDNNVKEFIKKAKVKKNKSDLPEPETKEIKQGIDSTEAVTIKNAFAEIAKQNPSIIFPKIKADEYNVIINILKEEIGCLSGKLKEKIQVIIDGEGYGE